MIWTGKLQKHKETTDKIAVSYSLFFNQAGINQGLIQDK